MSNASQPVALVTGASSGIGRASALGLAAAGYRVFGTSRKAGHAGPGGVTMLVADVTSDASVQRLVADVMAAAGRIDLLVNDAGYALSGAAETVAATILAAAQDRSPRLRYPSGKAARQTSFARRFLPRAMFDKTLHKQFGLS